MWPPDILLLLLSEGGLNGFDFCFETKPVSGDGVGTENVGKLSSVALVVFAKAGPNPGNVLVLVLGPAGVGVSGRENEFSALALQ